MVRSLVVCWDGWMDSLTAGLTDSPSVHTKVHLRAVMKAAKLVSLKAV